MQNPPPPNPSPTANLFDNITYLVHATSWLIAEALNTRFTLESIMAQADNLNTQVSELQANMDDLATQFETMAGDIGRQIQQLVDAVTASGANSAAIDAAVTKLTETNTRTKSMALQARSLSGSMKADDPSAPPTP